MTDQWGRPVHPSGAGGFSCGAVVLVFLLPVFCGLALIVGLVSLSHIFPGTPKWMPETVVEEEAERQYAATFPEKPKPDIDCPGPLKERTGAKLECVLSVTGDTDRYLVTIVARTLGSATILDIDVGESPLP